MSKPNKYAVGVDLGGTFIKFGVVSQGGKILCKNFLETKAEKGPQSVIKQIVKGVKELISKNDFKIQGIGIGAPGVVHTKKGTVENPPNFPGWGRIHLGKLVNKQLGIDVFVENDANSAAIGEMIFGAGRKIDSFIMITLGTGVGGGIILNKKLFRGESGGAGEIGHITIDYNGPKCNCGSFGCIEAYAGNNYLINHIKSQIKKHPESKINELINSKIELLTPKIISEAAKQGDEFAITIIHKLGKKIGYALGSVCNLLDVSKLVIGGGVSGFGSLLFESVENSIKERVLKSLQSRIKVLPAELKNDAGIKGASALVFYKA
jgi:glucokinase